MCYTWRAPIIPLSLARGTKGRPSRPATQHTKINLNMPALPQTLPPSSTKVLITGGTGYIGQWILRTLLNRGYAVRAVVRSAEKEQGLRDAFTKEGDHERLEFVVVEDLIKEGSFDEAVKGVDAIVHVASPLPSQSAEEDPNNTIKPAVQGSLNVLNSALKHGYG